MEEVEEVEEVEGEKIPDSSSDDALPDYYEPDHIQLQEAEHLVGNSFHLSQ